MINEKKLEVIGILSDNAINNILNVAALLTDDAHEIIELSLSCAINTFGNMIYRVSNPQMEGSFEKNIKDAKEKFDTWCEKALENDKKEREKKCQMN